MRTCDLPNAKHRTTPLSHHGRLFCVLRCVLYVSVTISMLFNLSFSLPVSLCFKIVISYFCKSVPTSRQLSVLLPPITAYVTRRQRQSWLSCGCTDSEMAAPTHSTFGNCGARLRMTTKESIICLTAPISTHCLWIKTPSAEDNSLQMAAPSVVSPR